MESLCMFCWPPMQQWRACAARFLGNLVASLQSAALPAFEFRLEGTFKKRQR